MSPPTLVVLPFTYPMAKESDTGLLSSLEPMSPPIVESPFTYPVAEELVTVLPSWLKPMSPPPQLPVTLTLPVAEELDTGVF